MRSLVALLLVAVAFAGCLDADDGCDADCGEGQIEPPPADQNETAPPPVAPSPEPVAAFTEWWMPCDWEAFAPAPATGSWMERKVLNIAHQGGENEVPSATLYALKTSLRKGADLLEIDVHITADGHLVVLHDTTVDRTTDGTGAVQELTLAEIKALDAAYWFVPGAHAPVVADAAEQDYVLRGIRTGERAPPPGCTAEDFTIPTLEEVLTEFPDVMMNIEIKNGLPQGTPYEQELAQMLSDFGRSDDTIVASFFDHWTEQTRLWYQDVDTSTGTAETALFKITTMEVGPGSPTLMHDALQVPVEFNGIEVIDQAGDFVADAHANGLAVHVWTINDPDTMNWLIDIGVDGIMTAEPTVLEQVLQERGVTWP